MKYFRTHIGITLLFCLGLFLVPTQGLACSKGSVKTEHSSRTTHSSACSKKQSAKPDHKACCNGKPCGKCKHGKDWGGKCKHSSCRCVSPQTSPNLVGIMEVVANTQLAIIKKQEFSFEQAYYSSGFYALWLPPKIS